MYFLNLYGICRTLNKLKSCVNRTSNIKQHVKSLEILTYLIRILVYTRLKLEVHLSMITYFLCTVFVRSRIKQGFFVEKSFVLWYKSFGSVLSKGKISSLFLWEIRIAHGSHFCKIKRKWGISVESFELVNFRREIKKLSFSQLEQCLFMAVMLLARSWLNESFL